MRTPFLRQFLKDLAEINNCYHNFAFLWEQFKLDNLTSNELEGLTSIKYKNNPSSKRFNIKLEELEKASQKTKSFILKSLYIQTYSSFEIFLKRIYYFCHPYIPNLPDITVNDNSMDQVINNLLIINYLTPEELDTLKYLRLRRNRLIHSMGKSQGEILTIINQKGKKLNNYWTQRFKKKSLYGIDFSEKTLSLQDLKEYIDIFIIYRILAEKIDKTVLNNSFNDDNRKKAIINFVKTNLISDQNKIPADKLEHQIIKNCLLIFGISIKKEDL